MGRVGLDWIGLNYVPQARRGGGPLIVVFEVRRKIVKKKVVTPIKNSSFLNTKAAAVPFISPRIISIALFNLHRQLEKIMPPLPDVVQKLRPDAVVDDLEEPPIAAGVRDLPQNGVSKCLVLVQTEAVDVDDWDVDGVGGGSGGSRTVRRRLDVTARDDGAPTLGEGLDTDYGFGPVLVEVSHHGQGGSWNSKVDLYL